MFFSYSFWLVELFNSSVVNILKLFKVYTRDDIRLVWIVYTANLYDGQFLENSETEEILYFSSNNLPNDEELRGELTKRLLHDILLDRKSYYK